MGVAEVGEGTGEEAVRGGAVERGPFTGVGEDGSGRGSTSGLLELGFFLSNSSISLCSSRCASP